MKNTIMPLEKPNRIRRYGSASACTAGAALIRSSNQGDAK